MPTKLPKMSLQEYQRQQRGQQDLEAELSTKMMPQELEGSQAVINTAPIVPPKTPKSERNLQLPAPHVILPPSQPLQPYFVMDPETGVACLPSAQAAPVVRPISPPATSSTSYEFLGVPVITSYNPQGKAKEMIAQRYAQEFRGMSSMGEALIRKMVDIDLGRERRRFEGLVWRRARDEELVEFAEWLMRGGVWEAQYLTSLGTMRVTRGLVFEIFWGHRMKLEHHRAYKCIGSVLKSNLLFFKRAYLCSCFFRSQGWWVPA